MGPNGGEAWRYFEMPELHNRDRLLFRRYLPVAKQLSGAGWEPVTRAQDAAEAAGALDDPREQERFADCLVHLREYLSLLADLAAQP